MNFCFGDIVIVEENLIGVIVKSWVRNNEIIIHEVYVRSYNSIIEYKETDIRRYMVRHKELSAEEIDYQHLAEQPFQRTKSVSATSISILDIFETPEVKHQYYKYSLVLRIFKGLYANNIITLEDFLNTSPSKLKNTQGYGDKTLGILIDVIYNYCDKNNIKPKYMKEMYKKIIKGGK